MCPRTGHRASAPLVAKLDTHVPVRTLQHDVTLHFILDPRSAIVIAALVLCTACKDDCAPSDGHSFICGAQRPEDVARIPGTSWLVFSGFSDGAGLKLVDTRTRSMRRWYTGAPAQLAPDAQRFGFCPAPPDPALLNAQGLSLRTVSGTQHDLYVANHGGRESIEIFRIDAARDEP